MTDAQVLAENCSLLRDLDDEEQQQLFAFLIEESYPVGETIIREGNSTQNLWIIARGRCEVVKGATGIERQLAVLDDHSVFGEMSFFNPAPHSASVRAVTPVELVRLARSDYERLLEVSPSVGHKIAANTIAVLAERLRRMDEWTGELVEKPGADDHQQEWHEFRSKLYSEWEF